MASVPISRVLVNPGVRQKKNETRTKKRGGKVATTRKKLTLKQKLFFGTPAQRAAAKLALKGKRRVSNPKKRKVKAKRRSFLAKAQASHRTRTKKRLRYSGRLGKYQGHAAYRYIINPRKRRRKRVVNSHRKRTKRVRNVGQILTYTLGNPGGTKRKKRSTTVARRRRKATSRRRVHRRRRNPSLRSLLGMTRRKRRVTRRRRGNPGMRRRRGYRRNPGILSGAGTSVLGVIGGAALTKFLVERAVPAQFSSGAMGYIATAFVAYLQGYLVSKFAKKPALGSAMQLGGWTYLGLKILNDMGLGGYSAFGLKGAMARSSFYTPQVNMPNSLTTFVRPDMIPAPVAMGARRGRVS